MAAVQWFPHTVPAGTYFARHYSWMAWSEILNMFPGKGHAELMTEKSKTMWIWSYDDGKGSPVKLYEVVVGLSFGQSLVPYLPNELVDPADNVAEDWEIDENQEEIVMAKEILCTANIRKAS